MNNVLNLVEYWIFNQSGGECAIEGLRNLGKKIPLSELFGVSHVFCKDKDCKLYTPCSNIGDWIKFNPELYDSEILCFAELIDECSDCIEFDINDKSDDKLQKLYSVVLTLTRGNHV